MGNNGSKSNIAMEEGFAICDLFEDFLAAVHRRGFTCGSVYAGKSIREICLMWEMENLLTSYYPEINGRRVESNYIIQEGEFLRLRAL